MGSPRAMLFKSIFHLHIFWIESGIIFKVSFNLFLPKLFILQQQIGYMRRSCEGVYLISAKLWFSPACFSTWTSPVLHCREDFTPFWPSFRSSPSAHNRVRYTPHIDRAKRPYTLIGDSKWRAVAISSVHAI